MTVRQVFYQATVQGIVEKTERGYDKVKIALASMRRAREMPYDWIVDFTRWQRKPRTFRDVAHALQETSRLYRKDLWAAAESYVEIWLEKDALAGVLLPVTSKYDVPLMVARGYASHSFLSEAAEYMEAEDRPVYIYHFGDFDPSGVNRWAKDRADIAGARANRRDIFRADRGHAGANCRVELVNTTDETDR